MRRTVSEAASVDEIGVTSMRFSHRTAKAARLLRFENQMYVIGYQAVGPHFGTGLPRKTLVIYGSWQESWKPVERDAQGRSPAFMSSAFIYDSERDIYLCPAGEKLTHHAPELPPQCSPGALRSINLLQKLICRLTPQ
jgi:hypothetical protein